MAAKRKLDLDYHLAEKKQKAYHAARELAHQSHETLDNPGCTICHNRKAAREQKRAKIDKLIQERDLNHEAHEKAFTKAEARYEAKTVTFKKKPERFWRIPVQWQARADWEELKKIGWVATETATPRHTGHTRGGQVEFARRRSLAYPSKKQQRPSKSLRTAPVAMKDDLDTESLSSQSFDGLSSLSSLDMAAARKFELEIGSNSDDTSDSGV